MEDAADSLQSRGNPNSQPFRNEGRSNAEKESCTDPHVLHFDRKFEKARELLIFMEETKIWQELLEDCNLRAGVNAKKSCLRLNQIVQERIIYDNAKYSKKLRPEFTAGIPEMYENP